jgi:phage/plasmid-like protein (TIGR03299 family)
MAHEIEIIDGVASTFFVGETPWHGLGTKLDQPPTIKEAIQLAGLDWTVTTNQLFAQIMTGIDSETGAPVLKQIPTETKAVIRSSDHKVLGCVGEDYTPIQNIEAFEFFQPAIDAGLVTLETAGSLQGGKRVWVLAKLTNSTIEVVKDDPIEPYVLLSNGHDGKCAVHAGPNNIRVVCQNTLTASMNSKASKLLKLKHTKNVKLGLKEIQAALDFQKNEFRASMEAMKRMASYGVDQETINAYIQEVFEPEIKIRANTEESANKSYLKLIEKIQPLMEGGRGNDNPAVRGTMWALYNGVTEYLTHVRGRDNDNRLESLWFGVSKNTNQRAFDVAVKMAA